jgi:diguanylate cyclase (GGDEF)-like protein
MRMQVWKAYLAVAGASIGASVIVPAEGWVRVGLQVAIGYAAVAAILAGVRRNAPGGRALWLCFAAGVFGNASGILVEQVDVGLLHGAGFPSVADAFHLSLYPAVATGLALLIRRRTAGRDLGALVDATTVTTGLGLLAWVFLIRPVATDESIGLLGHIVSAAYPVGDIVLVAMTVRLHLGAGSRAPSYWLATGSLVTFLAGDTTRLVVNQLGVEPAGYAVRALPGLFLAAFTLLGAAALHPSVRGLGQRTQPRAIGIHRPLLAALTLASLIAPGVLAFEVARGRVTDGVPIVIGCVTLFLLVVTRMTQLVNQVERQAKKVRELSRTDELTGLPNRRAWVSELPRAIERARRGRAPLTVAMIDLDHFKQFNDAYGHPAGDRLLKAAAAAWAAQLRAVDHLARYGGEEFILLLHDADPAAAVEVIARLREATPLGQAFSAGVATWDRAETSDELIARADAALYDAKRGGRDRIILAQPQPQPQAPVA